MTRVSDDTRRAGRPRSAECDRAILDAAIHEYATRGFDGMSVDAVAARAGVSKATIYRRYPSKIDLVIASAYFIADERAPKPDTGTLRGDLEASMLALSRMMRDPELGRVLRMVIGDSDRHPRLGEMHQEFMHARRRGTKAAFERAIARGEMRADVDLEIAADCLGGPLFYRHVVSGMPIDDAYVRELVDTFIRAYGC